MSQIVLLSGGSGMRLWPLSNEARAKQFLKVLRDAEGKPQSMVQRTVSQIRRVCPEAAITIATSASQVSSIQAQV
ncbi:MAG: sugar phosphate nucleotidyltransferase, partial [Raoultibacter sp.]